MGKPIDIVPEQGLNVEIGLLLAMLDDNTQNWREELGDVPQEAVVWQPVSNGHSIGAILFHIADVEAFWLHEIATGQPRSQEERDALLSDATDQYGGKWPAPPIRPLAWYYEQHDAIRVRTREIVQEINNPEHVGKRRDKEFTLRWLLYRVLAHEAYHGGQAVLLALQYSKREGV